MSAHACHACVTAVPRVSKPQFWAERCSRGSMPLPGAAASSDAVEDWSAAEIADYLSRHEVLQRVNSSITDAVRSQAANPLLHMAALLRRPQPRATTPAASSQAPTATPAASSQAPTATSQPPIAVAPMASSLLPMLPPSISAPAFSASASIGGLLRPGSVDELARLLRDDGLDLSLWGTAGAKGVRHLLAEINATECSLRQPADGGLVRELSRVDVELILRGRVLVETHTQVGGRTLQRFKLLSARLREGENWNGGVRRLLKSLFTRGLGDAPHAYTVQEESHTVGVSTRPAFSYPGLATECTRHYITVVLDERSNLETLGIAGQDRFTTIEYPENMTHVPVMTSRLAETCALLSPAALAPTPSHSRVCRSRVLSSQGASDRRRAAGQGCRLQAPLGVVFCARMGDDSKEARARGVKAGGAARDRRARS